MAGRILTGGINLAVLAALAWADLTLASGWMGVLMLAVFSALAAGEAVQLVLRILVASPQGTGPPGRFLPKILGLEAAGVLAASLPGSPLRPYVPAIIVLAAALHGLAAARDRAAAHATGPLPSPRRLPGTPGEAQARLRRAGGTAVGVAFVLAWIPGLLASLAGFLLGSPGPGAAYAVVLATKASDIGGYLAGKRWGRTKIAPSVSPGKSMEGTAGGTVLSIAVAIGLRGVLGGEAPLSLGCAAGLGVALALTGLLGDLFESLLKRAAGVKDSGHGIPTTGGFLDMIDSLLIAAPVAYLWLHAASS